IKKEARGSDDEDLGEVKETDGDYVIVQKGMINKEKFYIPKNMAESYDGSVLRFNISKEEVRNRFMGDSPPVADQYSSYSSSYIDTEVRDKDTANVSKETDTHVPLIEERVNVSKRESTEEANVTKEPVTETKTVEVPVTHEEITIEKRPPMDRKYTSITSESPVESKTEIKIPLKKEEVEVTKQPYVKEEVVVKKKPVTETRQVSEEVKSETVSTTGEKTIEEGIKEEKKE
ncbi:MAG TPA: YsnF/AvaK domain-containing protein, partial [Nitrososphaeraceae archaeon]|nr:YsnF/AvaK domain-containing protein [Nitrososphaeraceae archaeon]